MKLFDLHCDTALKIYTHRQPLADNDLHISVKKTAPFDTYVQIAAIYSRHSLPDEETWEQFLRVSDHFREEIARTPNTALVRDAHELAAAAESGRRTFVFGVEDARLLCGDLTRMDILAQRGVRVLTLCWAGETTIGGSHDTAGPLTDFGRDTVRRAFELGIVPDVSHASRAVTAEAIALGREAGRPVIASHSNSYAVHEHTRNLTDDEFRAITRLGGIVGVSLAPGHLAGGPCGIDAVGAHILRYLELGGEDALCLGCDYDGIPHTPSGLEDVSRLPALAAWLDAHGVPSRTAENIFYNNAFRFAQKNFR